MTHPDPALISADEDIFARESYQVSLPDFYGPMDLLLSLIEQEDLEITEISLAQVTDQYVQYINELKTVSPDALTDFLVVAARLVLLKSQVLLPKPPPGILSDDDDADTDDLVQQLKDYKRFKSLAAELNELQATSGRSFVRVAPPPKIEPKLDIGDLTVDDLLLAVRRALAVKPDDPDVDTVVSREVVTIGRKIGAIRQRLSTGETVKFGELLTEAHTKVEVIVTLLAVLELIKRRVVDVEQTEQFGEISIVRKEDAALSDEEWRALSEMEDVS